MPPTRSSPPPASPAAGDAPLPPKQDDLTDRDPRIDPEAPEPITPELVLVDPELRARVLGDPAPARASLTPWPMPGRPLLALEAAEPGAEPPPEPAVAVRAATVPAAPAWRHPARSRWLIVSLPAPVRPTEPAGGAFTRPDDDTDAGRETEPAARPAGQMDAGAGPAVPAPAAGATPAPPGTAPGPAAHGPPPAPVVDAPTPRAATETPVAPVAPQAPSRVEPVAAAAHGTERRTARRRWRYRPGLSAIALALLTAGLIATSILPSRGGPTFAREAESTHVVVAWAATAGSPTYVMEIRDGENVVWKNLYDHPYADERIALAAGRRYTWRAYVTEDRKTLSPASGILGRGTFVVGP